MKSFEKLVIRLKELFGNDLEVYDFKSLHTGHLQKARGAWSWFAKTNYGIMVSTETVKVLNKCQQIGCSFESGALNKIYVFKDTDEECDFETDE